MSTRIVDRHEVLAELSGGPVRRPPRRHLDDAFTRLKLDPERGPPPEDRETHRARSRPTRRWLRDNGAIDLDDLVALAGPTLLG